MVVRGGPEGPSEADAMPGRSWRARAMGPVLAALVGIALAWFPASGQAPDSTALGRPPAGAEDPARAFTAANQLYEAGRFAEAAKAYQAIVDRGFESASLYFNLGNAYLKSGELGEAIVSYERARALAPRADDIRENLERARSLAVDVVPEPSGSIFLARLAALKDWLSPGEALAAASLGLWLALTTAAATRLLSRGRRWARAIALACVGFLVLTSTLAAIKVAEAARRELAVVVVREVPVRTGPGENYTVRFNLHEGTTVRVLRTAGEFQEIELTAETGGWVPNAAVTLVRR